MYIFLWETQSCKKKSIQILFLTFFIKHQKTKKQIRPSHLNRVSQRTNRNALYILMCVSILTLNLIISK